MSTCSLGSVTKLTQIIKMQGKVRTDYIQICKLIYQLNNKVNDSWQLWDVKLTWAERLIQLRKDDQCRLDGKLWKLNS